MKEYKEKHQQGTVLLENREQFPLSIYKNADLGLAVAPDGRVWVCINGIAFLRFSPHPDGKMKGPRTNGHQPPARKLALRV